MRPASLPSLRSHRNTPTRRAVAGRVTAMAGSQPGVGQQWVATISSSAPEDKEGRTAKQLEVAIVDLATGESCSPETIDNGWESFVAGGGKAGWARKGLISVPEGFTAVGAVVVDKGGASEVDKDYLSTITLATLDGEVVFPTSSWVVHDQGQRVFFSGTYLPKDTPEALKALRESELKKMQGTDGPQPLTDSTRAYGYQVYDDLGKDRPALGGSKQLPYPRHLYNARKEGDDGPGKQWLPLDERFDDSKTRGFNGGLLEGIAPAVSRLLPELTIGGSKFESYQDVLDFFSSKPHDGGQTLDDNNAEVDWDLKVDSAFADAAADSDNLDKGWFTIRSQAKRQRGPSWTDLMKFRAPRVLAGRGLEVLGTDAEWGRQCVAGMHPCVLVALTKAPAEQFGSAISAEHVDGELAKLGSPGGLAELVAQAQAGGKPRLFMIDYQLMDTFWGESEGQKNRAEHAGRALLYLMQSADGQEEALLPLAFELKHRKTAEMEAAEGRELAPGQGLVYARQELVGNPASPGGEALWTLAKTVFRSMDSGYHQLISHWLRCHACSEPFGIALNRQLSAMHPVYKLMHPHFRYTLDINSKARSSLINQGGIIESCFTPGPYAMRLSAVVYGAAWRFHSQALPEDLAARGMLDKEGKLWLGDYPYAQDGLELWHEFEAYFTEYLSLYYSSPDDVVADVELQAWWNDVKERGHPDMRLVESDEAKVWGFEGPIPSVERLVRVLTTIAWTASAHHAAVNFGQYDFASLLLNVSSLIRRPIPRPPSAHGGSAQSDAIKADAAAYQKLVSAKGEDLEEELLSYAADPLSMVKVMVTVKLLSIHAENEQTLDERNVLITDPAAMQANTKFMNRMAAMEARFQTRNANPSNWSRFTGQGGDKKDAMNYTLLIPPSHEGLTFKGVPFSVSI